jgi:DNA mismatch repair ATPase MutS
MLTPVSICKANHPTRDRDLTMLTQLLNAGPLLRAYIRALNGRSAAVATVRQMWGQPGAKEGWLRSRYFDLTRSAQSASGHVDDKTWKDLEFDRILSTLDTTVTPIGSQYLYKQLRTYNDDAEELSRTYQTCELLKNDQPLREEIQVTLAHLRDDAHAEVADLLFGPPPQKPKHHVAVYVGSTAAALALIAAFLLPFGIWIFLTAVAVNLGILYVLAPQIRAGSNAKKKMARVIAVAERLANIRTERTVPQLARLIARRAERSEIRRKLKRLAIDRDTPMVGYAYIWLELLFLVDLLVYLGAVDTFNLYRPHLVETFELLGSLDATIAIACFMQRVPDHCKPRVVEDALIDIQEGHHPLIANPTKNSVRLKGKSALVTGTNMAGKTTFIKMVGTNIVLGRTLGVCLASSATLPRSSVMACIHGEHSIASGKSHYFAAIETILSFVRAAERGECRVFLIDELFRGTNTTERIAAAKAVLEALGEHAQVLVTTHDVELQDFLGQRFDMFHFQEDPDIDEVFDHRIRPGAYWGTNAIRLLARVGFPRAIIEEATRLAQKVPSVRDATQS